MFHDIVHGLNHVLNKNKELTEMYIAVALRKFAVAMFGIFVPVYLFFELNYPLPKIGIFFIITFFVSALAFLLSSKVSEKIGFKKNILISSIILIFALAALYLLKVTPAWFYPSAILFGAAQAMFWFSVHADMSRSIKKKKGGAEVSWIFILISISSILGPLLAGFILDRSGFEILFVIVTAILILSSTPLFLSRDVKPRAFVNFREIISSVKLSRGLSYFSEGAMYAAATILWPLFAFLILNDYLELGFVFSAISIITPFILVFAGNFVDHTKLKKTLIVGALIFGVSLVLRAFVENLNGIIIVMALGAIAWSLMVVAMHKSIYVKARKRGNLSEIIAREAILSAGRIFILLILVFSSSFYWGFIIAGLTSIFFFWFR